MSIMDSALSSSLKNLINCCSCNCSCTTWHRSVKRKLDLVSDENDYPAPFSPSVARVEVENECVALREALARQQQLTKELNAELEEERNASASATTEAMSMILRLQREKAEAQMEARQYKRFVEEKMAHDQQELVELEDLLYKRDQVIQSLNFEVRAYKHRLMSFGLSEDEADAVCAATSVDDACTDTGVDDVFTDTGVDDVCTDTRVDEFCTDTGVGMNTGVDIDTGVGTPPSEHVNNQNVEEDVEAQVDIPQLVDYPPLKCNLNESLDSPDLGESSPFHIDKFAFGETPHGQEHLQELDDRINQLEQTPRHNQMDGEHPSTRHFVEKVGVGQSPKPKHPTRFSTDSFGRSSSLAKDTGKDWDTVGTPRVFRLGSIKKKEDFSNMEEYCSSRKLDNASNLRDDMTDRIYTIDFTKDVHSNGPTEAKANVRINKDYVATPTESLTRVETEETKLSKLYRRLQALEAERDSMRQEFVSMKTDQTRLLFMKAIAQHMSQKMSEGESVSADKPSPVRSSSSTAVLKWVTSVVSWRRKARPAKYMFGQSDNNVGLLSLLDQKPQVRQWRCVSRTSAS